MSTFFATYTLGLMARDTAMVQLGLLAALTVVAWLGLDALPQPVRRFVLPGYQIMVLAGYYLAFWQGLR